MYGRVRSESSLDAERVEPVEARLQLGIDDSETENDAALSLQNSNHGHEPAEGELD